MSETSCPTCGDEFGSEMGMKVHHSKKHSKSIGGEIVECAYCGKERRETKTRANKQENFFCDHECFGNYQSQITGEDHPNYTSEIVECEWCGDDVERTQSNIESAENNFCSNSCQAEFQREERKGDWSHLWEGGSIETTCANCDNTIYREQWQYEEYDRHFCDLKCFGEHKSANSLDNCLNYGEQWMEQRKKALEADDYECQVCGLTESSHKDEFGMSLHVHHKTPLRKFEDIGEAHDLQNIVTLCCRCHRKAEVGNISEVEL